MTRFLLRLFLRCFNKLERIFISLYTRIYFFIWGVEVKSCVCNGKPFIRKSKGSEIIIGKDVRLNNGIKYNPIGNSPCVFVASNNGKIQIGDNVGLSSVTIYSSLSIKIEENVMIGAGVSIYDTDFHSLKFTERNSENDLITAKKAPIVIKKNVFIGAKSIVLKGVTIGENSIIGAGSVVTRNVPANQIWAGNPARYIKNLTEE